MPTECRAATQTSIIPAAVSLPHACVCVTVVVLKQTASNQRCLVPAPTGKSLSYSRQPVSWRGNVTSVKKTEHLFICHWKLEQPHGFFQHCSQIINYFMNFFTNTILTIRDKIIHSHLTGVSLCSAAFRTAGICWGSSVCFVISVLLLWVTLTHAGLPLFTLLIKLWIKGFSAANRIAAT